MGEILYMCREIQLFAGVIGGWVGRKSGRDRVDSAVDPSRRLAVSSTQYFELDGVPVRRKSPSAWPEVYRSDGVWERHSEPVRLLFWGRRIGEREATALIQRWERMVAGRAA